jgi:hypothetical protein
MVTATIAKTLSRCSACRDTILLGEEIREPEDLSQGIGMIHVTCPERELTASAYLRTAWRAAQAIDVDADNLAYSVDDADSLFRWIRWGGEYR